MTTPHLVLIGPMGAGKSTIGRMLSDALKMPFVDSDKVIEERSGADIPWIFDIEGEAGFREREAQVLADLMQEPAMVIATGGGAILLPQNRQVLKSGSRVVYLKTSVKQQLIRTAKDKNRPLLQQDNPGRVLRQLAEVRNPLYLETADWSIETDGLSPRAIVRRILNFLNE
ncbi:MAG: shikimate kinase AroK [Saccharospirillum sp.]